MLHASETKKFLAASMSLIGILIPNPGIEKLYFFS